MLHLQCVSLADILLFVVEASSMSKVNAAPNPVLIFKQGPELRIITVLPCEASNVYM